MPRQLKDGSTPGERKSAKYDDLFTNPVTGLIGEWDWAECNTRLMAEAFTAINSSGALMSLVMNANHTAGKVSIISGGFPYSQWFITIEDADAWFAKAAQARERAEKP